MARNDSERLAYKLLTVSGCCTPQARNAVWLTRARLLRASSVLPEPFEPIRRQLRVAHRAGDGTVAQIVLDSSRVLASGAACENAPGS
jgi:hypothetical protein